MHFQFHHIFTFILTGKHIPAKLLSLHPHRVVFFNLMPCLPLFFLRSLCSFPRHPPSCCCLSFSFSLVLRALNNPFLPSLSGLKHAIVIFTLSSCFNSSISIFPLFLPCSSHHSGVSLPDPAPKRSSGPTSGDESPEIAGANHAE